MPKWQAVNFHAVGGMKNEGMFGLSSQSALTESTAGHESHFRRKHWGMMATEDGVHRPHVDLGANDYDGSVQNSYGGQSGQTKSHALVILKKADALSNKTKTSAMCHKVPKVKIVETAAGSGQWKPMVDGTRCATWPGHSMSHCHPTAELYAQF